MSLDASGVSALDRPGYVVLEAITAAGKVAHDPNTFAKPMSFICIDGKTYWLKGTAQQGLVAELVAGRLAAKVGAGPGARIIRVSPEVQGTSGAQADIVHLVVGSEDVLGAVNARDLSPFMQSGQFDPGRIDPVSRARAVVFQTWIGAGDSQVLISLTDGTVSSIDHGACFSDVSDLGDPSMIVTDIPGVAPDVGRDRQHCEPALRSIERLGDRDLLDAVSRVPAGDPWRSPVDRRTDIARWLLHRRGRLRTVIEAWLRK